MKKKYSIILIIFSSLFFVNFLTIKVSAIGNSFFPSSARLQPLPAGVHANISRNIENSGTVAQELTLPPEKKEPALVTPLAQATEQSSSVIWWILGGSIVSILILYFALRKPEREK